MVHHLESHLDNLGNPPRDAQRVAVNAGWYKLTADKRASITKILGTQAWEQAFYSAPEQDQSTLFSMPEEAAQRTMNVDGIEAFVKARLEKVFPLVLGPKRLLGPRRAPLFSLFFAMSNKSEKAAALARRILHRL